MSDDKPLDEQFGVRKGSVDETATVFLRTLSEGAMLHSGLPFHAFFVCGLWDGDKGMTAGPVLASVSPEAKARLGRVLRELADKIEAGEVGRDRIPVMAGDA